MRREELHQAVGALEANRLGAQAEQLVLADRAGVIPVDFPQLADLPRCVRDVVEEEGIGALRRIPPR
jgi:hypothetical protein